MFDGFINNSNPYGMDTTRLAQLNYYNQINLPNSTAGVLDSVRQKITNLTSEEIQALMSIEAFVVPFQNYQNGLQEFVLNRFAQEYVATDKGRVEIENVNKMLDSNIDYIKKQAQAEKEELAKLAKLLKENPELLKQIEK